jgi:1,4-dihydroxy-2-naphthoate octaprenyltransferase
VLVGSALAVRDEAFDFLPALAALFCALALQVAANLANDVFDFQKGADRPDRLGPPRVTQLGLLTPREVRAGMLVALGVAMLLGLYLAFVGGWLIVAVGVACIVAAVAYTGGRTATMPSETPGHSSSSGWSAWWARTTSRRTRLQPPHGGGPSRSAPW